MAFLAGRGIARAVAVLMLGAVLLFAAGPRSVRAQGDNREYQIKAAFLFNFVQFVKWPGSCFASGDAPLRIGILGDDPFGSTLEGMVRGESINGHRLVVVHGSQVDELAGCHLIFISRSEEGRAGAILSQLGDRPILTVSEIDGFASRGGAIDFYLAAGKVRFEINPDSARKCGLKISSQLLSLGKIVE